MKRIDMSRIFAQAMLLGALFLGITSVSAQEVNSVVAFEGTVSYQTNGTVSRLRTSGAASKLGNFSYDQEFNDVKVIVVYSNAPFRPGNNVYGPAGASSSRIPVLETRTYYTNITYSGSVRLQRGKRYSAVLLAVDGGNRILAAHNFSRGPSTRTAKRGLAFGTVTLQRTSGNEHYIPR
jgi:hypothetical protein